MAKITDITRQKRKNRINLYVDNSFYCGLNVETAVKNGIVIGAEFDESELEQIIGESETRGALDYALGLVSKKLYSEFEIIEKLKNKGYGQKIIDSVLEKLREYKLVDDQRFAEAFAKNQNRCGKKMVLLKLKQKGIDKGIIKKTEENFSDQDEIKKIEAVSKKYLNNKEKNKETFQKLYRYLVSKGFEYDTISSYISRIRGEEDESWD
ncbi:MAG: RecX family transcriptional regulator [Clostridia bacterium]|nr:RecX family transcriptional regulator [Clostridia bacterium]